VLRDALRMDEAMEHRRLLGFVVKQDLEAAVQIALGLEALGDQIRIERELASEHVVVRAERDRRARAARRADLLELALRLASLEVQLRLLAVALDRRRPLARQRVDRRRADTVQTARDRVALAALELAA